MNDFKRVVAVLGVVAALGAGCDDVRLEPRFKLVPRVGGPEPAQDVGEQVRRDLEARLREMDGELQELKHSVGEQTGDAQKEAQKHLDELQSRKDELAKELEGVGREGGKAVGDLQKGIESALKDLERELNKLGTNK